MPSLGLCGGGGGGRLRVSAERHMKRYIIKGRESVGGDKEKENL